MKRQALFQVSGFRLHGFEGKNLIQNAKFPTGGPDILLPRFSRKPLSMAVFCILFPAGIRIYP
ncbi:hypothetical protein A4H97_16100 [Niastella yeongjuensis]|uniref:Uncharacterized protein n=1 Tax=Niastella yeongjuensis TaxID=354355 RepID=A0A1V9E0U0_9BACT|nr:hypothetical protein A4H97_16100 [Niastella yeongjuensis]